MNGVQTDAYRAGFPGSRDSKGKTLIERASRFFNRPYIKARLDELRTQAAKVAEERFNITAGYVLNRLAEIDQMDFADIFDKTGKELLPVNQWPMVWRKYISGFEVSELFEGKGDDKAMIGMLKKIKWPDKVKNLELLGNHVSVGAFRKQLGVSNPTGGPVEHSDVTWREKLRQEGNS